MRNFVEFADKKLGFIEFAVNNAAIGGHSGIFKYYY